MGMLVFDVHMYKYITIHLYLSIMISLIYQAPT